MSERDKVDPVQIVTSMAWERAKGELRSIVAAYGSVINSPLVDGRFKFEVVSERFEDFIKGVEDDEYHL